MLLKLLDKLAYREGFGDILANGFKIASERIGKGSEYYAIHVKGQGVIDGLRTAIGRGLGIATSTRGSRHLDGATNTELRGYSPEISNEIFGVPTAGIQGIYEGKAELVFWFENLKAIVDSLGMCCFSTYWGNVELLGPEDCVRLLTTGVGVELSGKELMKIGRQIHDIEKAFNTLHAGFTRKDDMPPFRMMIEPVKSGSFMGSKLDWNKYNKMLDEYYEVHDWDVGTGLQTQEGLEKLGLKDVADKLRRGGKLIV